MVVKRGSARVEAARMRRVAKPEALRVEVVAELVAEGAQKRAERSDLLADRRPHPDADQRLFRSVVPKKLGGPAALADSPGGPQGRGPGAWALCRSRMPG